MKKSRFWFFGVAICTTLIINMSANAQQSNNTTQFTNTDAASSSPSFGSNSTQSLRIGIVNTKKCLENSKLGKQEQTNFEKLKQQMESVLQEKEKILAEIESKLDDDDYMDSISDETASELKRKKRTIRNEGMQLQNQYMQGLQQANVKIVQQLTEMISKASALVAKETTNGQPVEIIFSDEACTYFAPRFDVTDRIIAQMDILFDAQQKENGSKTR